MKQVDLVFVPAWLKQRLKGYGVELSTVLDIEKLSAILSVEDVLTYLYANPQVGHWQTEIANTPLKVLNNIPEYHMSCSERKGHALVWKHIPATNAKEMQLIWQGWHFQTAKSVLMNIHENPKVAATLAMVVKNETINKNRLIFEFSPIGSTQVAITAALTDLQADEFYAAQVNELSKLVDYFDNPSDIWGDPTFRAIAAMADIG